MSRLVLITGSLLLLAGCFGGGERALLPVVNAPLREDVLDVPPSGIIQVRAGDTIYTLANRYQVTPRRIILANNMAPPYNLAGVQTLSVPKPRAHIVAQGDSLDSISARYKVSKQALMSLNNLSSPYDLHVGLSISIPRKMDYSLLDLPSDSAAPVPPASSSSTGNTAVVPKTKLSTTSVSYSEEAVNFAWPVDGQIIQSYGTTSRGVHNDGVNIAAREGTSVRASQSGEVAFVGANLKAFGNLVLIKHRDGWITAYAHLNEVRVKEGDYLDRGTVIGGVGQTGRVDSPQLHFEIRKSRNPVNPEEYLS